ncbi:hypothetical protein MC885_008734 [Smutsia gigantea]|nr:hypothetical protein MC885_008734 [Smutsia gigantea]
MRRGGTLHPPRPRVPAANHHAPPFLPREGQVFHTDSCDFKDQGFGEVRGLPKQEGNLSWKGERQQPLPRNQQSPRCCGRLKEPGQKPWEERQAQDRAAF